MGKFVLQVPKWQGELFFSREILMLVGVVLLLIVGTLFCFWGYKYFRTVLFVGIGVVVCYVSYLLVEPMTTNLAVRMFLTVSLTFLGVCLVYFLDIIFCYILDKLRIRNALGKRSYLLAAPLGAAILGLTIYYFIWRDEITVGVFSGVCLVFGLIFQHFKRKKQIRFRSYNDLIRIKRPKQGDDGLEILSAGTAGAAVLAPVSSVLVAPEPEAVHEPEPENVPALVAAVEPEAVHEPEPENMPALVAAVEPEAVHEPEPENVPALVAAVEPEAVHEPEPENVPALVAAVEPEAVHEPEPENVPVSVAAVEPETVSGFELEPEFEPEPVFVMNAELQALSEIESEFAAGSEYGRGLWPEPEQIIEEIVESEPVVELEKIVEKIVGPELVAKPEQIVEEIVETGPVAEPEQIIEEIVEPEPVAEPGQSIEKIVEPEPVMELEKIVEKIIASAAETEVESVPEISAEEQPVPMEISEEVKELILRKMESEEELLEEAFFVKRISRKMAEEKQNDAQKKAEKRERREVRIETANSAYPGKITVTGKGRKSRRKREEGMARGAAIAAAGLGAFIAGRISKGGD